MEAKRSEDRKLAVLALLAIVLLLARIALAG
jgi:hypothetical protein